MEDFVYIILLVVWLLVSFLRKKPKKRPEPAKRKEPATAEGDLSMEDMLEDFFGGGKKKKEQSRHADALEGEEEFVQPVRSNESPEPAYAEAATIPPRYERHVGKTGVSEDFEFSSEGKIMTIDDLIKSHKTKEAMELALAEEQQDAEARGHLPDFDLKTAVVFSEILNKKYY